MQLAYGFFFEDFNNLEKLKKLHKYFIDYLNNHQIIYDESSYQTKADFLIALSPFLDDFIAELFGIQNEVDKLRQTHNNFDIIYDCKRRFVQRDAVKKYPREKLAEIDFIAISAELERLLDKITLDNFANKVLNWQQDSIKYMYELDIAAQYASYLVHNNSSLFLFQLPEKLDKDNLITSKKIERAKANRRVGFDYFDSFLTTDNSLDNAHYCIYCHKQEKDSCSKGLQTIENSKPGCPLKQKISEMNYIKAKGFNIAALAIIIIDNPMLALTGHRICNDCANACIFQKQDPVNIPLVESDILTSVLELPYGFEIYDLMLKWNPLNFDDPLPKPSTGYNVLVAGIGPAGIGLSHYLSREGHNVVAIDGLKISNIPFYTTSPIKYWQDYKQKLSQRIPQGFGGVAEYGITVRWDKNNLTLARTILERRSNFKLYGSIMYGSNITMQQAEDLGFDHIALCVGAGNPRMVNIEGAFAKGVKSASDFLMSLQSGGAFLENSFTNLTIRMPIAIIGAGLTAIDTAVEALYYYPLQVKKFAALYNERKHSIEQNFSAEDKIIATEFLEHAQLLSKATNYEEQQQILNEIGGVTIYCRNLLKLSSAYKVNYEEIVQAQALGVKIVENVQLKKINTDEFGYAKEVEFEHNKFAAKTVLISIGNQSQSPETAIQITKYGDCNPAFSGSVVKALASAKEGYKNISALMLKNTARFTSANNITTILDNQLISTIQKVNILSDNIVELIIHSPLAAKNFQPGQFFRLLNYSDNAANIMEPLALTGAYTDLENGTISLIIIENGGSSQLCRYLVPGEQVSLMGPTGKATVIDTNKNILLIGGGVGNAVLFSIGAALKHNNCKVTYIAGYKKPQDVFYMDKIIASSDQVIWCCEEELIPTTRLLDISIKGNVINGMKLVSSKIDKIICIGSSNMMQAVLKNKEKHIPLICSINSPMQCMMKGICGNCIQKVHTDLGYVFTCTCQDQDAEIIDFNCLHDRLAQNSLQEKMSIKII